MSRGPIVKPNRKLDNLGMNRTGSILILAVALAACTPSREPVPITPPGEAAGAAVVRRPLPEPVAPVPPVAATAPGRPLVPAPPVVVPAEYVPKVGAMCVKHPEMGPCQYERDVCRRSGGRVYAAGGIEITLLTEAEYDKKVMRVRFKAN